MLIAGFEGGKEFPAKRKTRPPRSGPGTGNIGFTEESSVTADTIVIQLAKIRCQKTTQLTTQFP